MGKIESKYTVQDLKRMQSWSLDKKIQVTKTRILEFASALDNKIFISFSGGKDSTVLLHIARQIIPNIVAVFSDTGLEYPELRDFVKTIDNVVWVKPSMNFRKVIDEYGYPIISKDVAKRVTEYHNGEKKGKLEQTLAYKLFNGTFTKEDGSRSQFCKDKYKYLLDAPFKISHKCCDIMKKKPMHDFQKQTGMFPVVGTMASESTNRQNSWKVSGCNITEGNKIISKPLSFWTEQDILEYILRFNLDYASVYGDIVRDSDGKLVTTGCKRTGCMFCGFGCHLEKQPNRFVALKETHPTVWRFCMMPSENGGLGMKDVLDFIGVESGWDDSEDYSSMKTKKHTKEEFIQIYNDLNERYQNGKTK